MDVPEAPRVTIDGGPGWQLDGPSAPDVVGTDPGSGPRWRPSRGVVMGVAASALLGFVAATVLAAVRHDRGGEIDAATLSVSVWSSNLFGREGNVRRDGRPRVLIPFQLENTGPRDIHLLSVRLPGTEVETEDLAGRPLAPGGSARLDLERPLDCGREPRQIASEGDVSRLVVRARTGAGERQVTVRAALNTGLLSRGIVTAMCGELPPDEALITDTGDGAAIDGGVARLSLQVANGSRYSLTVGRLRAVVPWLSARFVDEQGRAVPMPLSLPAGDFSTPRVPWDVRQGQTWRVEITVPDCRVVPSTLASDIEEQLLSVDVDSGQRAGTARLGGDSYSVVRELTRSACSS